MTQLLSGKEASLYVVERGEERLAAKVYKAREQRSFKHVSSYVAGRNQTRNSRDRRAQHKKSSYGRELEDAGWRGAELQALQRAFYAGVRVPEPFMLSGDVLLMELLVDEDGYPAPRLADLELTHAVAGLFHQEVFQLVRRLLSCDLVHGDLSAYNVLLAHNGLNLIDMPQVVDASANSDARAILQRDLQNVTEHLARFDARLFELRDCGAVLFDHYQRGTLERAEVPEPGARGGNRHHRQRAKHAPRPAPPKRAPVVEEKASPQRPARPQRRAPIIEHKPPPPNTPPPAGRPPAESGPDGAPPRKRRRRRRRGPRPVTATT